MSDLVTRAREFIDHDGAIRRDAEPTPLTASERADMIAWIAAHEDPIRADLGDYFCAGMFLGAVRRQARRDTYERQAARVIEVERKRQAERQRAAAEAKAARELRAQVDRAEAAADMARHLADRAEANESIADFRRQLNVNHCNGHRRPPTEAEIRDAAEKSRAEKWRKKS